MIKISHDRNHVYSLEVFEHIIDHLSAWIDELCDLNFRRKFIGRVCVPDNVSQSNL